MTTFVLVPGAWLGGWVWKRVVPLMGGHDVRLVALTGMGERVHLASKEVGIETAITDVLNVIEYEDLSDIVLVGHSFAGKVVAAVADRIPERIETLLFLDALRPSKVRRAQAGSADWPPKEWGDVMDECRRKGDGWKFPLSNEILDHIGSDVRGEDREWMLSKVTPLPVRLLQEPITLSEKYDSIKKAYIFCTRGGDDIEEIKKQKLDGPDRIIDSGHWPMITKPQELSDDIIALCG